MHEHRSYWEKSLSDAPHPTRGFSQQHKQEILRLIEQKPKNKAMMFGWVGGAATIVLAVIVMMTVFDFEGVDPNPTPVPTPIGSDEQQPDSDPDEESTKPLTEEERFFALDAFEVGDEIGGMKITAIRDAEGFSKGSIVEMEGKLVVSGAFEYRYEDTGHYNYGDLVFYLDEESAQRIPMPDRYEELSPLSFTLHFNDEENLALFAPYGTTGTTTIEISAYDAIVTEAWGGVINQMNVENVTSIETIPRDHPSQLNTEATENLTAFPMLSVDLAAWSEENTDGFLAWVEHIRSVFNQSLKYDERRILEEDREQIRAWLNTVFSASMTEVLLDEYVPAVEGGYYIAPGSLSIIPSGELEINSPGTLEQIIDDDSDSGALWLFKVDVRAERNESEYTLQYSLVNEQGEWKIEHFEW